MWRRTSDLFQCNLRVHFGSVQVHGGRYALRKDHMRSNLSLTSFPNASFVTLSHTRTHARARAHTHTRPLTNHEKQLNKYTLVVVEVSCGGRWGWGCERQTKKPRHPNPACIYVYSTDPTYRWHAPTMHGSDLQSVKPLMALVPTQLNN